MHTNLKDSAFSRQTLFLFALLALYFSCHIFLRVSISPTLDFDEAEQAVLSQWLLPGYTEQPPLYSWLQYLFFALFGKNVFAISLLKNSILFFTYVFFFFAAYQIFNNENNAALATISLLLLPQIGWESQRDMTHTAFAVLAATLTLWQVLRMRDKRGFVQYLILGVTLSIGILSKSNYLLFLAVLIPTLISIAESRTLFCSVKIIISILVIAILCGNYLFWMFTHQDIVFSATYKFNQTQESNWIKGPATLLFRCFLFISPLWAIFLLFFGTQLTTRTDKPPLFSRLFTLRYLIILLLILMVVIITTKVTNIKDRWLQPILFLFPLFLFARISIEKTSKKIIGGYYLIVLFAALFIYGAFMFRVLGAAYLSNYCRLNYPIADLVTEIKKSNFSGGVILSDDRFMAGNMVLHFPTSNVVIPGYGFEKNLAKDPSQLLAIVWERRTVEVPMSIQNFLYQTYGFKLRDFQVQYKEYYYLFSQKEPITMAFAIIPLRRYIRQ
jgi:lipopolysaccharide core galacturonosyltransferase RgtB